ncbi:Calcium-dependent lipid-binding-like protein [Arachis hypogaea]|nr:Calcium-dependent lipid-binding-like protein [Arachis hypogaea]
MAVVVAVIARGGGYRGGGGGGDGACYSCGGRYNGGGGGGSCNNCGYSGLLQGTAQQALADKLTHRAQEQFQMVLEEKSRFAFDVDLDAPKVRISLRSRGSARCDSHFLLDFGHFTLHTAESQSDEQRHNLYSRFYIPGRDFAAFFTDCGSDFGSCSLVKPTHDSQIISSPWAKEADNVYSVIDRCGMAVLVNQNHGTAEHIAKTMETCNQPTPDSLHSKLAPWSRDLVVDGRILVWKSLRVTSDT